MTMRLSRELHKSHPNAFVRLYPWDVRELGATTNVQGYIVRSAGDEFLSIEVAPLARKQLLQREQHRNDFLKALLSATESGS